MEQDEQYGNTQLLLQLGSFGINVSSEEEVAFFQNFN